MIKLSIGITVCDRDCGRLPDLLKRIEAQVTVGHEVIVIDNTTGGRLKNMATYSFGYNAYQYDARAKIIELAQGEYLWFIDGDDDIVGRIDTIPYTEDMIAFSFISDPGGEQLPVNPCIRSGKLLTPEVDSTIRCALWNKFIKRSLYNEQYETGIKMTTSEDMIWMYRALKNAKTLRTVNRVIYHHHAGFSTKVFGTTPADLDHLLIGHKDMIRLLKEIAGEGSFLKYVIGAIYEYLLGYTRYATEPLISVRKLVKLMPCEVVKGAYQRGTWDRDPVVREQIKKLIAETYGISEDLDIVTYEVMYDDGRVEMMHYDRTRPAGQ